MCGICARMYMSIRELCILQNAATELQSNDPLSSTPTNVVLFCFPLKKTVPHFRMLFHTCGGKGDAAAVVCVDQQ